MTGGTETGKVVAGIIGRNLTRFTAELGGKGAVIAFEDVDVERCVAATLFAAFVGSGQTCVEGARLLVHRILYDRAVAGLVRRARAIRLGNPLENDTQMGPLVSAKQRDNVERYVRSGIEQGATVAAGGKRPAGAAFARGYYFEPTVFTNVSPQMRIAQEEIFGPVVCVMSFNSEDEAVAIANGTQFGLGASVWTRDGARAHRVAHRLQFGIVWINDHHRVDPTSPWGGFKMSGIRRENGPIAYEEYTQIQSVIVNLSDSLFDWYADDGKEKRLN